MTCTLVAPSPAILAVLALLACGPGCRAGEGTASVPRAPDSPRSSPPWLDEPVGLVQPNPLREPPLPALAQDGLVQVYRFSCFPSFGPALSVRLEIDDGAGATLILKRLDRRGADDGNLRPAFSRRVDPAAVSELLALIDESDFWNMAPRDPDGRGPDGSTWMLEGMRNGAVHAVSRWCPDGPYRIAMDYLLRLAGLDACDTLGLLGQYEVDRLEYDGMIVVGDPPRAYALVKTPHGDLKRARIGDGLGAQMGMITAITEDYLETTEVIQVGPGEWVERVRRLFQHGSDETVGTDAMVTDRPPTADPSPPR